MGLFDDLVAGVKNAFFADARTPAEKCQQAEAALKQGIFQQELLALDAGEATGLKTGRMQQAKELRETLEQCRNEGTAPQAMADNKPQAQSTGRDGRG